ncbi:MAG: RNA pyrophosphohydrolase [Pseudomonadota bacterium]|nr:RNA pyrophosphohydrolase [Pseudomonadota bacterium]
MIDKDGFRENVGIILLNENKEILCGRRVGMLIWQMPQGGIENGESAEQAMYRELEEEVGLEGTNVDLLGHTDDWLHYRLPEKYQRRVGIPRCVGQKQIWFLLKFKGIDSEIRLDRQNSPEFEEWGWFEYWKPLEMVVDFKKQVYKNALTQLERFI